MQLVGLEPRWRRAIPVSFPEDNASASGWPVLSPPIRLFSDG